MKKINRREFIRMSAVLAAAGALTACGGSKSGSTAGSGAGASAEGVKGLTLKLSHNANEQHLIHKAMTQFANEVNEKTNGDIKIEVYPNATLGGEKDNLEQMGIGALDMAKVSAASLETFAPVYEAFSVPYIFNNRDHFYGFMDSDQAKEVFHSTEAQGFIALTWLDSGTRSFYTVKTPVMTPADLKGLKIRTMDSPMAIEMMNCFGGSATAMPISDVYTAMQSGVIDGAENNETALTVGGHGEVAKCYSYDEHTRIPDIVLISTKVWNKFSAEQQEIVQAAADAAKETYKADWQAAIEQAVKDADLQRPLLRAIGQPASEAGIRHTIQCGGCLLQTIRQRSAVDAQSYGGCLLQRGERQDNRHPDLQPARLDNG